ncbi:flavo protein [Jimgerdemannia flammicorona]|uniref:Flavo protein n=1 Tax=Jimgerdemannia flammicorona TaxID=994334 RepID=A0A433QBN8_9FUNG|nr:flavo protein [Jimgerdemannia flammicorona]
MASTPRKTHILVGATGSVASIKVPTLVSQLLQNNNVDVKIVPTAAATHFFKPEEVPGTEVLVDADEWRLRNWADLLVLAPLDANTLAKIANGLCDNLLVRFVACVWPYLLLAIQSLDPPFHSLYSQTCILRAWDPARPVIVCPAMNTNMWDHPFTAMHLGVLKDKLGFRIVAPITKLLACGDLGIGAMAEPETIVAYARQVLEETKEVREARIASVDGNA